MRAIRLPSPVTPGPTRSPFVALRHRNFRLYWGGQLVSTAGSMMQMAGVAWQVYLLTHSTIALGLMGLVRVVPILAFSLGGGVVADVVNRRVMLLFTQTALLLASLGLAIATLTGVISIWLIYALTALAAGALAFDNPARQAMLPSLVPRHHLANALSLNSTMFQVANVIGPGLAGIVIATRGVATVYLIDAASFLAVIAALTVIKPPPVAGAAPKITVGAAIDGLRFVFRTPILRSTMLLDFIATFFGSAVILLPVFAHDVLRVGAEGYGILYASDAAGAVLAGIAMVFLAGTIRRQGLTILIAVGVYCVCTVVFGFSHLFLLSIVALGGVGAADTVSMILRQTVRQTVTPDALRGRMTSVQMVFFMGGPQLGNLEAGLVARGLGAPFSVISGGFAALIAVGLIASRAISLRRYEPEIS